MSAEHDEELEPGQREAWDRLWDLLLSPRKAQESEPAFEVENDYLN
jgi:hypothetical protein